jgi:hypothetical protein
MSRYDRPSHHVYMYFFLRSEWQVEFLESDLKTPLPKKLTFADSKKISELKLRGRTELSPGICDGGISVPEKFRPRKVPEGGFRQSVLSRSPKIDRQLPDIKRTQSSYWVGQ